MTLLNGDCREILPTLEDNSVDAIVTDPPAGISFMGKKWDSDKGGRDTWIAWLGSIMAECMRVLKPGGHAFVWALPRTSHWTGTAIENAGFEIRDSFHHIFGSGFPKSLDISKAIDAAAGAEREVVQERKGPKPGDHGGSGHYGHGEDRSITTPTTPQAKQWNGWGTAAKPSHEVWWLARKPFPGTVASNVQEWGTGGINVAACRVGTAERYNQPATAAKDTFNASPGSGIDYTGQEVAGRWPPNLLLTHSQTCHAITEGPNKGWNCAPDCPIREMDRQSGESVTPAFVTRGVGRMWKEGGGLCNKAENQPCSDTGGASRFFPCFKYCPKPSRAEREQGCQGLPKKSAGECTDREDGSAGLDSPRAGAGRTSGASNNHPTVKASELMCWLIRLITPPGGTVLDPFMGSGSTGIAAHKESCGFIGIEMNPDYFRIAEARIKDATKQGRLF